MEKRTITSKEYAQLFTPAHGYVLILKDGLDAKYGSLYLSRQVIDRAKAASGTGIIMALSPFKSETEHENYLMQTYKVGQRVCFSSMTPHLAPAPPSFQFKNDDDEVDASVVIKLSDVIGVLSETPDESKVLWATIWEARK